jgi:hypothetical protein
MRRALRRVTGIREIRDLLHELRVEHEFFNGGRHTKLRLTVGGQQRVLIMNNSSQRHHGAAPAQLKAIKDAVVDMRRALLVKNSACNLSKGMQR